MDSKIRHLRLRNKSNAVQIVLAHLCNKLDAPDEKSVNDSNEELNGAVIFEKLIMYEERGYKTIAMTQN